LTLHAVPGAGDGVGDTEATGSLLAAAWELPEPPDAQPASATATRRTNAQRVMHQGYVDHRWKPAGRCRVRTLMPRSARAEIRTPRWRAWPLPTVSSGSKSARLVRVRAIAFRRAVRALARPGGRCRPRTTRTMAFDAGRGAPRQGGRQPSWALARGHAAV